jgi:hypothetical protein
MTDKIILRSLINIYFMIRPTSLLGRSWKEEEDTLIRQGKRRVTTQTLWLHTEAGYQSITKPLSFYLPHMKKKHVEEIKYIRSQEWKNYFFYQVASDLYMHIKCNVFTSWIKQIYRMIFPQNIHNYIICFPFAE